VVPGESAGGNLTAALMQKLRELGLPLPTGAYLLSPWLDMTQSGEAYERRGPYDPLLTRDALENCAIASYSTGASRTDPFVSPAKANLAGLPPLLIQVGTDELLLSDSLDFARRAALEGLDVQLQVWRGMVPPGRRDGGRSGDAPSRRGGLPGLRGQLWGGPRAASFRENWRGAFPSPPPWGGGPRGPPPGGGRQEAVGGVLSSWLRRPGKIQLGRLRSLPVTSFRGL